MRTQNDIDFIYRHKTLEEIKAEIQQPRKPRLNSKKEIQSKRKPDALECAPVAIFIAAVLFLAMAPVLA